ncbi:hypothetical protein ACH82I_12015 [Brevibacterium sp. GP-SGM9]|uniref:hypothetical protein n=1 Tax=Brevibacterium sp. GP-SGM9 TaxID=3376990 RepID=UPI0039A77376
MKLGTSCRLSLRVIIAAGAACAALAVIAVALLVSPPSLFVQDAVYDNVPSRASCADVPSTETVERVIGDFPEIGDADPILVDRCDGAIIEIQVADHGTREDVENYLKTNGKYETTTGWWWRSVPIAIRNV